MISSQDKDGELNNLPMDAGRIEHFIHRLTKDKVRFVIGTDNGKTSGIWSYWTNKNDVYIGVRSILGSSKISLHGSGHCRFALLDKYYNELVRRGVSVPPDRALVKWTRPETPEIGARHACSIVFPTDFLVSSHLPNRSGRPLLVFPAAPSGKAVEVGFFYSKQHANLLEESLAGIGKPLFYCSLPNGEHVHFVARVADFDRGLLPANDKLKSASATVFDPNFNSDDSQNLVGIFFPNGGERKAMHFIEAGGLKIQKRLASE